jgi:hypothetical protein
VRFLVIVFESLAYGGLAHLVCEHLWFEVDAHS